jgi:hypothetical protein
MPGEFEEYVNAKDAYQTLKVEVRQIGKRPKDIGEAMENRPMSLRFEGTDHSIQLSLRIR